jgi:hypothetical protein
MFKFANETVRRVNRTHVTSYNGRRTNKKATLCDVTKNIYMDNIGV